MNEHEAKMPPVHPGEILLEDFLEPMGITPYRLGRALIRSCVQDAATVG